MQQFVRKEVKNLTLPPSLSEHRYSINTHVPGNVLPESLHQPAHQATSVLCTLREGPQDSGNGPPCGNMPRKYLLQASDPLHRCSPRWLLLLQLSQQNTVLKQRSYFTGLGLSLLHPSSCPCSKKRGWIKKQQPQGSKMPPM